MPELKNWQKLDFSGFYGDFTPVWVQIDVFGTCPNLLGREGPFQLFRPKNHWITFKTWYKSHKIPILCLKNPTQIAEMHFWERWKVIFMLLLANKWPIKLAGVYFMARISDQRINSCCWAWKTTLTSFCDCKTSHFWHCFTPKELQSAKTKASENQNFGQFAITKVAFLKCHEIHTGQFYWSFIENHLKNLISI